MRDYKLSYLYTRLEQAKIMSDKEAIYRLTQAIKEHTRNPE